MIALLIAAQVLSPAPKVYVPPVAIKRPPDYRGVCHAREKGVPVFDFAVEANGKGKKRKLTVFSKDGRLPSGDANVSEANRYGDRTVESWAFRPNGRNWVASVEWIGQGRDVWMTIEEPIVAGKSVHTEWFARCELTFGARS